MKLGLFQKVLLSTASITTLSIIVNTVSVEAKQRSSFLLSTKRVTAGKQIKSRTTPTAKQPSAIRQVSQPVQKRAFAKLSPRTTRTAKQPSAIRQVPQPVQKRAFAKLSPRTTPTAKQPSAIRQVPQPVQKAFAKLSSTVTPTAKQPVAIRQVSQPIQKKTFAKLSSTVTPTVKQPVAIRQVSQPIQKKAFMKSIAKLPMIKKVSMREFREVFRTPFIEDEFIRFTEGNEERNFKAIDWGYKGRARTDLYDLGIPTAPVFHPYHPGENPRGYLSPAFTLNIKFPRYVADFVPTNLHRHLAGVDLQNIDMFLIVQDAPWQGVPLLLRPQSWLDPDAPFEHNAPYSKSFQVQAGIFSEQPRGPLLSKKIVRPGQPDLFEMQQDGGLIFDPNISVHNTRATPTNPFNPLLVSSSDTLILNNMDLNQSNVLFSLTKHGNRAAVVKHIILNPQDETVFEEVLQRSHNFQQLDTNLKQNKARFSPSGRRITEDFDL